MLFGRCRKKVKVVFSNTMAEKTRNTRHVIYEDDGEINVPLLDSEYILSPLKSLFSVFSRQALTFFDSVSSQLHV